MPPVPDRIREAGPYLVELWSLAHFVLYRRSDDVDDPAAGEFTEQLLIEPGELPALRDVLMQVWAHPHYVQEVWDTSRAWLTTETGTYTQDQINAANENWTVSRTAAAVAIEGPLWNPAVYPSGAFRVELEYSKLEGLLAALGEV